MPDPINLIRGALPPELTIDDYLDGGGQGSVFRGSLNGLPVAIKAFDPRVADRRRIDREIDALQAIQCPSLVRIEGATKITVSGTDLFLIAYELLSGGDLRTLLDPSAPLPDAPTILRIGTDVGAAIEALWDKRIVHRDVKPANIMSAGGSGRYVLVDIGLARHIDRSAITLPGFGAGTLGYMSPEQARGRQALTIASDVFSLGITLYELSSHKHPFDGDQSNVGRVSPVALESYRPDFPLTLCKSIHEMLSVSPHRRPTTPAARLRTITA